MYEIMMYSGAIGFLLFFLLSVFLFIKNKVPSAVMYFINMRKKGVDIWSENKKRQKKRREKAEKTELLEQAGAESYEPTEFLDEMNSAAESTEILSEYSDK
ncbi:hypothetical protein [Ruminococcus sp. Marseille-P6503]|uniref:hypothetical protein n=1 Tax=Ruminococcus sp. Marseille-P6503 TaxID=2364796 RepID=UPI000F5362CC|nr:hypothetical protein [Ruminococcus sp. Marseille-P6503]